MRVIVTCPGCRRRLRLNMGPPGKRYRCPACSTPFVFGARTNEGSLEDPEYLAFEVFDEEVVSEGLEIIAPPTKPISKPPARPSKPPASKPKVAAKKPTPATTSGPRRFDDENKLDVDFELTLDHPEQERLLPDDFGLIDDFDTEPPDEPKPPPPKPVPVVERKPESLPPPSAVRKPAPPPSSAGVRKPAPSSLVADALRAAARLPPPSAFRDKEPPAPTVTQRPLPESKVVPATPPEPVKEPAGESASPSPAPVQDLEATTELPTPASVPAATPETADGFPINMSLDPELPSAATPPTSEVIENPANIPPPEPTAESKTPSSIADADLTLPDDFLNYLDPNPPPSKPPVRTVAPPPPMPEPIVEGLEIIRPVVIPTIGPVSPPIDPGFTVVRRPGEASRPQPPESPAAARAAELDFAEQAPEPQTVSPSYSGDYYDDGYDEPQTEYSRSREPRTTRANWMFAFWGVSAVLAGLGLDVIAIVLFILSPIIGWMGLESGTFTGFLGVGILMFAAFGLLALQQAITFLGYALCLGSPAKGMSRLWAIVTMVLAAASMILSATRFVIQNNYLNLGLYPTVTVIELLKWVFFLVYLLALGKALRNRSIQDEVSNTLKMTIVVTVVIFLVAGLGMCAIPAIIYGIGSSDIRTGITLSIIVGVLTWVVIIGAIILILVRQITLLMHVREKLADKISRMR